MIKKLIPMFCDLINTIIQDEKLTFTCSNHCQIWVTKWSSHKIILDATAAQVPCSFLCTSGLRSVRKTCRGDLGNPLSYKKQDLLVVNFYLNL